MERTESDNQEVARILNRYRLESFTMAQLGDFRPNVFAYWESLGSGIFRLIRQDNEVLGSIKAEWGWNSRQHGFRYTARRLQGKAEIWTSYPGTFPTAYQAAAWVEGR